MRQLLKVFEVMTNYGVTPDGRPLEPIRMRLGLLITAGHTEIQTRACKCLRRYLLGPRIPNYNYPPPFDVFSPENEYLLKWAKQQTTAEVRVAFERTPPPGNAVLTPPPQRHFRLPP